MEIKKSNVSKCKLQFVNAQKGKEQNVELIVNIKSDHNIDMCSLESLLNNIKNIQIQGYNLQKNKK